MQRERRNQRRTRHVVHVPFDLQTVAETDLLNLEVLARQLAFGRDRHQLARIGQQHAEQVGQIVQHRLGLVRIAAREAGDAVQAVEEKVRPDARLQRLHARLLLGLGVLLAAVLQDEVAQPGDTDQRRDQQAAHDGRLAPGGPAFRGEFEFVQREDHRVGRDRRDQQHEQHDQDRGEPDGHAVEQRRGQLQHHDGRERDGDGEGRQQVEILPGNLIERRVTSDRNDHRDEFGQKDHARGDTDRAEVGQKGVCGVALARRGSGTGTDELIHVLRCSR